MPSSSSVPGALAALAVVGLLACSKDKPQGDTPPPPPPSATAAAAGACASGGGQSTDAVSAAFFPRTVAGFCLDPQGETKTYGEKGRFSMDEVCTTAFDGECEVYKRFGLRRVVALHYVDDAGKGSTVEVNLSQFESDAGAYGMYTLRVVAGDPADPTAPKPLELKGAGAIGTGRAYVWRGPYLAELQYNNEAESPATLAKSSEAILKALGKDLADKLPGSAEPPSAVGLLPKDERIPNGVAFAPKDALGVPGAGAGAQGYYRAGASRWRVFSAARDDAEQAKDVLRAFRKRPGASAVPGLGDEAVAFTVGGAGGVPKTDWVAARKGTRVLGVGDEEHALEGGAGKVKREDAVAKVRALVDAAPAATPPKP